jgi:hypothetical protein
MSLVPSTTLKVEAFATEVIENIAGHMDDVTLFSFLEVSRTIRTKSRYIYGERFLRGY